jgi:hypothetical protein
MADSKTNLIRDSDDWKTGDEPMTEAQRSYLNTLATEAAERVPDNLSKAQAPRKLISSSKKPAAANKCNNGGPSGTRTLDTLLKRQVL